MHHEIVLFREMKLESRPPQIAGEESSTLSLSFSLRGGNAMASARDILVIAASISRRSRRSNGILQRHSSTSDKHEQEKSQK